MQWVPLVLGSLLGVWGTDGQGKDLAFVIRTINDEFFYSAEFLELTAVNLTVEMRLSLLREERAGRQQWSGVVPHSQVEPAWKSLVFLSLGESLAPSGRAHGSEGQTHSPRCSGVTDLRATRGRLSGELAEAPTFSVTLTAPLDWDFEESFPKGLQLQDGLLINIFPIIYQWGINVGNGISEQPGRFESLYLNSNVWLSSIGFVGL